MNQIIASCKTEQPLSRQRLSHGRLCDVFCVLTARILRHQQRRRRRLCDVCCVLTIFTSFNLVIKNVHWQIYLRSCKYVIVFSDEKSVTSAAKQERRRFPPVVSSDIHQLPHGSWIIAFVAINYHWSVCSVNAFRAHRVPSPSISWAIYYLQARAGSW